MTFDLLPGNHPRTLMFRSDEILVPAPTGAAWFSSPVQLPPWGAIVGRPSLLLDSKDGLQALSFTAAIPPIIDLIIEDEDGRQVGFYEFDVWGKSWDAVGAGIWMGRLVPMNVLAFDDAEKYYYRLHVRDGSAGPAGRTFRVEWQLTYKSGNVSERPVVTDGSIA